jgi:hypothetical protein
VTAVEPERRPDTRPAAERHWSDRLPPGNGRSVYAGIWKIPGTIIAAIITGEVVRWWLQ